jgi:outer membrane protein assembly factor BamE (lipoprotein component of BamABCDE complex)
MKNIIIIMFAFASVLLIQGCSSTPKDEKNSPFTTGNVQLSLKQGVSTQAEVLEKFGPPNIAAVDSTGNDLWTYQKFATVTQSSGQCGYFWLVVVGGNTGTSGLEQTQKTMTLIIKFDQDKKIKEFKSMSTNF